jgi:hypothetical protein
MSMGYNLAFDYDYQNKIRNQMREMEKKNPYWQPMLDSEKRQMQGRGYPPVGAEVRSRGFNNYSQFTPFYKQTPKAYKSSGNEGYTYYHQNELDNINKLKRAHINYDKVDYDNANKDMKRDDVKIYDSIFSAVKDDFDKSQLKGYGKQNLSPAEKSFLNLVVRTAKKAKQMEGGISKKSLKKALKVTAPVARKVASTGVKVGLPILGTMAAEAVGVPAPVGLVASKLAADAIAKKIGGMKGGFRVVDPASNTSLIDEFKESKKPIQKRGKGKLLTKVKPLKGGLTETKKKQIAKNLIKTFGAVALSTGAAYLLPKAVKYLASKYGVDPELAEEIFGLARFIVSETVRHNVSGGAAKCDVGCLSAKGGAYKDTALGKQDAAVHSALSKLVSKHMKGGKLNMDSFKKEALKLGKKAGPIVAKKGIPLATKAIGTELGLPPTATKFVGDVLGELASSAIKGKGKKASIKKDIGKYTGGAKPSAAKARQQARGAKVREIMKEYGLPLHKASKYIKENNIEY